VRGPEAGSPPMNSRYITDFHRMGVNRIGSCLFLQTKKKFFFGSSLLPQIYLDGKGKYR